MVVVYSLILLLFLSEALANEDCNQPSCFTKDYGRCLQNPMINIEELEVVMVTPDAPNWTQSFYRSLLILVCEGISSPDEDLCWLGDVTNATECEPSCNNCTTVRLSVFRGNADTPTSSTQIVQLLEQDSSKLALRLVGFNVLEARSLDSKSSLFDVPIASWVCVGVGILLSFLFVSKPVWWDLGLHRCLKMARLM